jgi:hypothetical protein
MERMSRWLVLILAEYVALGMAAIPPWRMEFIGFPGPSQWVEYAPVFEKLDWITDEDCPAFGGPYTKVRPAWDLFAGQYAALLLAVLFALRCLGRKERWVAKSVGPGVGEMELLSNQVAGPTAHDSSGGGDSSLDRP